jgi:uncharacterized protein YkwD
MVKASMGGKPFSTGSPIHASLTGCILENKWMKKAIAVVVVLLTCALGSSCFAQKTKSDAVNFQGRLSAQPDASESERAKKLYELAKNENRALRWDSCLAGKAYVRARKMTSEHYFGHEDPKTGKNPVWNTVKQCIPDKSKRVPAGENLAKGIDTPANIHKALMKSPKHRKNIKDRRFNHLGVGCYDYICVELFAGY